MEDHCLAEEKIKRKVEDLSYMVDIMPPGDIFSMGHRICIPATLLLVTLVPFTGLSSAEVPLNEDPSREALAPSGDVGL